LGTLSAIDTGVLIEYIDELGDYHLQANAVIESVITGGLTAIIAHPVFAELYYVSCKMYEKIASVNRRNSDESPGSRAEDLVKWLYKSPNITVLDNTIELAIEAGKIKRELSLALPDSYVIACAKLQKCEAIFKRRENEMKRGDKLGKLKKDHKVNLVFLEDFV
jgi:uncharacterized protein